MPDKSCGEKIQITPQGKIQISDSKVKLLAGTKNWNVNVRIQLTGCTVYCHQSAGEGYGISLDFSDAQDLDFTEGTDCLVQGVGWRCGDADAEPPTNQNCVATGDDVPLGDIVVAYYSPDIGCHPVYRGTYTGGAFYNPGEYVTHPGGSGINYRCILAAHGVAPPDATYWVLENPISYWTRDGSSTCTTILSYSGSMSVMMSLFEGEWYLTASFGLLGHICGASVSAVYPAGGFPFNDNLGDNPTGSYHYESGLGGTPPPPGTLILDIDISEV